MAEHPIPDYPDTDQFEELVRASRRGEALAQRLAEYSSFARRQATARRNHPR